MYIRIFAKQIAQVKSRFAEFSVIEMGTGDAWRKCVGKLGRGAAACDKIAFVILKMTDKRYCGIIIYAYDRVVLILFLIKFIVAV